MHRLEVSGAVRLIYGSLGVKRLIILNPNLSLKCTQFRFLRRQKQIEGKTAPQFCLIKINNQIDRNKAYPRGN